MKEVLLHACMHQQRRRSGFPPLAVETATQRIQRRPTLRPTADAHPSQPLVDLPTQSSAIKGTDIQMRVRASALMQSLRCVLTMVKSSCFLGELESQTLTRCVRSCSQQIQAIWIKQDLWVHAPISGFLVLMEVDQFSCQTAVTNLSRCSLGSSAS